MKTPDYRKILPYVAAIVIFLAVTLIYFSPLLEGKGPRQGDVVNFKGVSKEISDFRSQTGKEALWTNALFGGMPAYQISVLYPANLVQYLDKVLQLWLPVPANWVFLYFLGFFVLLLVMKVDPWLSIVGALAFGFSSYFFLILEAGHNTKAHAIGYMAPVVAGILLTYRGKYLWGGLLTAVALALELYCNHVQITYYLALFIMFLLIALFIDMVRTKKFMVFLKASAVVAIAALIAAGTSVTNLWTTYEYGKHTMRGKSELTTGKEDKTSGLDKSYATQWSYGRAETFSLMIPNAKGGASGYLGNNRGAMEKVDPQFRDGVAQSSQYWGDQPFTSGPVYAGAIICFLFILGLFVVKGSAKWYLLAATVFSILLSWGKNFMGLTDLFLDYFPAYNKFRAVSMILVIAELAIPMLAVLAFKEIYENPGILKLKRKQFFIAFGLTAGVIVLFLLLPTTFFDFLSPREAESFAKYRSDPNNDANQVNLFVRNLEAARISVFKADALRSLAFILLGAGLLFLYSLKKLNRTLLLVSMALLVVIDMAVINKRYINDKSFARKTELKNPIPMTPADEQILLDKDPDYRVLNTTVDPFADATTSYYHKSIGGYHGAKLKRYQELYDNQISKNNMAVLNMLNTRYFIVPDQNKNPVVQKNPMALGNAWFVSQYRLVPDADSEMAALTGFNPAAIAVIDQRFKELLGTFQPKPDSTATITLTSYTPNHLVYKSKAQSDQLAVFSEIYYKEGWNAYVDGKLSPYFRANYVLRAMIVPAGDHQIDFRFEPRSYFTGEKISLASSIVLILLLAGAAAWEVRRRLAKK